MTVAVLFARSDSNYKALPNCDVWDAERDALKWPGGCPVVAHPPCRAWGNFAMFAKPSDGEKELALWAVDQVRKFGGWTLPIHQHWWGHRAEKKTNLYIVGIDPQNIPDIPMRLDYPTHVIGDVGRAGKGKRPEISKSEREHTPPDLAAWLCELAEMCVPNVEITGRGGENED